MNFAGRPNADPAFLRRVIAIRDEEHEQKVRRAELLGGGAPSISSEVHDAAIRSLHAEGLNDGQIAARIGLPPKRVNYIRNRLGLKPNHDAAAAGRALGERMKASGALRQPRTKTKRVRALILAGWTDAAIAHETGATIAKVAALRETTDVPKRNAPGKVPDAERDEAVRRLVVEGLTDAVIAERVGMHRESVRKVRRRLGLGKEAA